MAFDIMAVFLAVLSILSLGMTGPADIPQETPEREILSGTADTSPLPAEPVVLPENPPAASDIIPAAPAEKPGSAIISGSWEGTAGIPFVASVSFQAAVSADGTAQLSGTVDSSQFGDSTFRLPVSWEYLGGESFAAAAGGTNIPVSCDGTTLTFPANPYQLGLVGNKMADQTFLIELHRR